MALNLRKGTEEAAEKQAQTPFDTTKYFKLKDGESAVIRFLTDADEWSTVGYHSFVAVQKEAPEGRKSWPKALSAVCRKTKDANGDPLYPDCAVEDLPIRKEDGKPNRPAQRTFAAAVLRELGKDGKYHDKVKDVAVVDAAGKPTGDIKQVPDIQYLVFGWDNFFGKLEPYAAINKTLLDRDYVVKRKGATMNDTDYRFTPEDPDPSADVRNESAAAKYGIKVVNGVRVLPENWDPDALIEKQSSDEYFGLYFDPRYPQVDSNGDAIATPKSNDATEPSSDLRSMVRSYAANSTPDFGD